MYGYWFFFLSPSSELMYCKIYTYFASGLGIPLFAHCSITHFAQIKLATVSDLLRSLKTNEQLWANRSGRSRQMSDSERIAQVAHDKWATMSNLLRSLMINERMSNSLKKLGKKSIILFFSMFYIGFLIKKNERFTHSLIFGEWCERIAQVAHQKWAMWENRSGCPPKISDVSESLRLPTKNERCEQIAQVAHQ